MSRWLVSAALVVLLIVPMTSALAPTAFPLRQRADDILLEGPDLPMQPAHAPAPAPAIGIGPGSHLLISIPGEGTFSCTANFLWTSGGTTYLGTAGHCLLPASRTATHGPGADYDASGVEVEVCTAACTTGGQLGFFLVGNMRTLGPVAYARAEGIGNDFGVVEVPSALLAQTRAGLPVWRGPTTATPAPASGPLCLYGNGALVGEVFPTMARAGVGLSTNTARGSWEAALPINSGDSGAALITCGAEGAGSPGMHGIAPVGIVTHGIGIAGVGVPGIGDGTTIAKAKQMATQAGLTLSLVTAG